ncbi:DUF3809 family protein [Oceanithermus sp.]
MRLERRVKFCLQAADADEAGRLLAAPQLALARLRVFRDLELEDGVLSGALAAPFVLIGEVRFPFRSRFLLGERTAELTPLPLESEAESAAELAGTAELAGDRVCYQADVALQLSLPEGEKWGGRAFRKMAEAAFERTLARTLNELA